MRIETTDFIIIIIIMWMDGRTDSRLFKSGVRTSLGGGLLSPSTSSLKMS